LPVAQIDQRDPTKLAAPDGAQLAAVDQPPDGALIIAKQARCLSNADLERLKLRTTLRLNQAL